MSEEDDWKVANERSEEGGPGGLFVQLKNDGDSVKGVFVGGPKAVETIFEDGKSVPLTEEHRAKGIKVSPRFKFNFFDLEEQRMRILEIPNGAYKDIILLKAKYPNFSKKAWEITRRGAKGDMKTVYRIFPEEGEFTPEIAKAIAGCKLFDLTKSNHDDDESAATDMESHGKKKDTKANGKANGTAAAKPAAPPADGPISDTEKDIIIGRLKTHADPKADATTIMDACGAAGPEGKKAIKFILKSQLAKAMSLLDQMEKVGETAEEDPFG